MILIRTTHKGIMPLSVNILKISQHIYNTTKGVIEIPTVILWNVFKDKDLQLVTLKLKFKF